MNTRTINRRSARPVRCLAAFAMALVLGACASDPAHVNDLGSKSPKLVLERFIAALGGGNIEAAISMTLDAPPEVEARERRTYLEWATGIQTGTMTMLPAEQLELELAAVVLAIEEQRDGPIGGRLDYDPIFFVKEDGVWKLVPLLLDYDRFNLPQLTPQVRGELHELDAWQRQRKAQLRQKPR